MRPHAARPGAVVTLDDATVDAIAAAVVERAAASQAMPTRLITARELAAHLNRSTSWVRSHADELGARRVGGVRPRLLFDLADAFERLAASAAPGAPPARKTRFAERKPRQRSRKSDGSGSELLPIRGVERPERPHPRRNKKEKPT